MNKKKIIALVKALVLTSFLILLTMTFTGNPVSKFLSNRSMIRYVQKNYSHIDLELEKVEYDMKAGGYYLNCSSRDIRDLKFSIYCDMLGRNIRDSYESDILNRSNTYLRLNQEFENYIKFFLKENLDYEWKYIFGELVPETDQDIKNLRLDQPLLVNNMPLKQKVNITIVDYPSWEKLADIAREIDQSLEENNIYIDLYDLSIEDSKGQELISIFDFKKEDLKKDGLPGLMEKNLIQQEEKFKK